MDANDLVEDRKDRKGIGAVELVRVSIRSAGGAVSNARGLDAERVLLKKKRE